MQIFWVTVTQRLSVPHEQCLFMPMNLDISHTPRRKSDKALKIILNISQWRWGNIYLTLPLDMSVSVPLFKHSTNRMFFLSSS